MHKFLVAFLALTALAVTHGLDAKQDQKLFINNPKSSDYKLMGKMGDHRFGVELEENKQFHHTRTAEDGVRLGCYGHTQDGKKYSTNYVADGKGYRLVPKRGIVTVYPKDGGEPRKASFDQSFVEKGETRSGLTRYVFPPGCESPLLEHDVRIPPIEKKDDVIEIPKPETTTSVPETTEAVQEFCPLVDCCESDRPKLVFPSPTSECQKVVKLIVPISADVINQIPVAEFAEVTRETNPVTMLLKLLRLLEKCRMT